MKISYNWLQDYLSINLPVEEVSELLTDIGLEVEGIDNIESVKGGLKGIVIGEVISKEKHPNADRLNITKVNIGTESLQIICGAPNVAVNQKVAVATAGTILYDKNTDFKIKKSKIRGEISLGMICSEKELGLGEDHNGIMVLDNDAEIGTNACDYFNLMNDIIFDIALTPNRSDAMSHIGVARDLKAVLNYKYPDTERKLCIPSINRFISHEKTNKIDVKVIDSNLCPRYSGLSISNLKVENSPDWLQNKLKAIGIIPTNNIVDITNYVLHETGQPLHAFDADKIDGNKIIVSNAKENTEFTTLDKAKHLLSANDLMICDAKKPLCIAGVYGGLLSAVDQNTTEIFLESAYFNPVSIRKTSKGHNLNTDASFRFERGCDPNITIYALKRAALLITDICGGKINSDIIDIYPEKIDHTSIILNYAEMDVLIGKKIDRDIIKLILNNLEIQIIKDNNESLSLLVPPFRADVKREIDVIEEILRIYGFNNIETPAKMNTSITNSILIDSENICNTISELLANTGFNEVINNSLIKEEYSSLIDNLNNSEIIRIINSKSKNLNVLRQSLLFSGLDNIRYNQNRKITLLRLFEFGKTYHQINEKNIERQHLQLLITGKQEFENWNTNNRMVDFFYLKERVEHILNRLAIDVFEKKIIDSNREFSEGYTYFIKKEELVSFGKVKKKLCDFFDINLDVYAADFNWDFILKLSRKRKVQYKPLNIYPTVRRDLSLLIDSSVLFDDLKEIAFAVDNKILKNVNLFDVYKDDKIPEGKKAYALSFVMVDEMKTLTDKRVDIVMNKIIKTYVKEFKAEIR